MGCMLSCPALEQERLNSPDAGTVSYGFEPSGTALFGVAANPECIENPPFPGFPGADYEAWPVWTPTLRYYDAVGGTLTSQTCSPVTKDVPGSLLCDVPTSRITGRSFDITVPYGYTTENGEQKTRTLISAIWLHEGVPITSPISTRTTYTTTLTEYTATDYTTTNTVWVDPTDGVCPPTKKKGKRGACVNDRALIVKMQQEPAVYSPLCATLTVPPAADQTYPAALSAYTISPPVITSACSCAFDLEDKKKDQKDAYKRPQMVTRSAQAILPRAPVTSSVAFVYPPKCNADLVLRAMIRSSSSASAFCATYTTITPSAGYAHPKYVSDYATCTARIVSGCSCLMGLSPPTVVPPTCTNPAPAARVYAGPAHTYKQGSTITVLTTASTTSTVWHTDTVVTSTYGCTA
ncbi:hypothetical protein TWF696_002829 [Orbilia brochopaga]|uniref:Uncharacterized protein n=1 Tax=Orbilia brochopaga TaxID=3140254 RepID=A0AAV9U4D7_9PEZI